MKYYILWTIFILYEGKQCKSGAVPTIEGVAKPRKVTRFLFHGVVDDVVVFFF